MGLSIPPGVFVLFHVMCCVLQSVDDQALHTVKSNIETLYSRLPITRTFKGNRKRFELSGAEKNSRE